MKAFKARTRPTEALAIAAAAVPTLPPTQIAAADQTMTLNMRVRSSTLAAVSAAARERGMTLKQVVCSVLADAGIAVAPADLEDRTPRRRAP